MIRSSSLPASLLCVLLSACGSTAPAPAPAPAPTGDAALVPQVAEAAINALARRKFDVANCTSSEARVISEADAANPPPGGDHCAMLVAHRADKSWVVVVRSPAQTGNVWAVVTVAPSGAGVTHIDYKP